MNIIASLKTKNIEDSLKYAYAFMQSKKLNKKECSFPNPKPTQFSKEHLFASDMYAATYEDKVPSWDEFKSNPIHLSAFACSCIACVDTQDKKRVGLMLLKDDLVFTCYGNYENEAKEAYQDIISIHTSL
ncbi:hypothetical protein [Viridibacillus arvi]|uniref:hypothetical protein n=1 Tax=Viridibacillus arvi TaxID=263475 RepID=UPI0034CFF1CC